MKTTRGNPDNFCPWCGKKLDAATGAGHDESVTPGDISICAYCGEVMLFERDLKTRRPTELELIEIQRSESWPLVERVRTAVKTAFKK
jgi:hypothetical protein